MKNKILGVLVCMLLMTIIYPGIGPSDASLNGPSNGFDSPLTLSIEKGTAGSYHTLAQVETILQNIATTYPSITKLSNLVTTYEGRSIKCLEISDNPGVDEEEPGVVYLGLTHAREWPSVEICLYIAGQLTSQYGVNSTITTLVNSRRIWIVPVVNPDGYHYCHDLGHDWYKNRHKFDWNTYGVDLNRNYLGSCNGDSWGAWGSSGSSFTVTHNPDDEEYCGPGPSSEMETQAIQKIFIEHDICASISWHTSGEQVLWPWGYTIYQTSDNPYLSSVGTQIAQQIKKQYGFGTYTPSQYSSVWYSTGSLEDWAYGYSHYVQGKVTFPFLIEACSSSQPSVNFLNQICMENYDGALYLLQEAEKINNYTARVLPPVIDDLDYDSDGNYTVSWQEQNPEVDPDYFELDELRNFSSSIDNVENDRDMIWRYSTDSSVYSTPAFADGKIFIGSCDYKIYCLNADDGSFIWSYKTNGEVYSSPAVANGKVYCGSIYPDNKLYCLNADTGDLIWSYATGNDVWSSPAVANGKVYCGSYDKKLYCLDADTGKFIWNYTTGASIYSSPTVANRKVYCGSSDNSIYCLNADTGSFIWSYATGDDVHSSPIIATGNGNVYCGSDDDKLYCLNADTGSFIWSYATGDNVVNSPRVANGKVYCGSYDGKIYCLNADNGGLIWNYLTGDHVSSPAISDGKVYCGSGDFNLYCLNADTGSIIWSYAADLGVSSPVVLNEKVYCGSGDHGVYCFNASYHSWLYDGFILSTSRSYSGAYSFYSGKNEWFVTSMRITEPLKVTKNTDFSFWCWYDIKRWDYAYIEVSKTDRCYDLIDMFSGSSGGWIYKSYSLENYEGKSVYLRFRYTTHDLSPREGFYVDDILPFGKYESITPLSNSITTNQYSINGRSPGVYFYSVRGSNSERGWGDFSNPEGIYVGTKPPNTPLINGSTSGKIRSKYDYRFSSTDPEGHNLFYFITWGDGTTEQWVGPYLSGQSTTIDHTWTTKGTYSIKVKARDIYGAESDWGQLSVTMPFSYESPHFRFFEWLFERFPHAFPILRHMMGY